VRRSPEEWHGRALDGPGSTSFSPRGTRRTRWPGCSATPPSRCRSGPSWPLPSSGKTSRPRSGTWTCPTRCPTYGPGATGRRATPAARRSSSGTCMSGTGDDQAHARRGTHRHHHGHAHQHPRPAERQAPTCRAQTVGVQHRAAQPQAPPAGPRQPHGQARRHPGRAKRDQPAAQDPPRALEYAVELELLDKNPMPALKWTPPKTTHGIDRRRVANPIQARTLLHAVDQQRRRPGAWSRSSAACTTPPCDPRKPSASPSTTCRSPSGDGASCTSNAPNPDVCNAIPEHPSQSRCQCSVVTHALLLNLEEMRVVSRDWSQQPGAMAEWHAYRGQPQPRTTPRSRPSGRAGLAGYAGFVGHHLLVSINTTRARPWGNVGGRGHRRVRGPYGSSPDRHLPVCGGAAGSCTVTRSPPAGRGVRVRVPSCAWVMLLTIARPRPTPAWSVRMRSVPR
jgi:hypothetical protein